MSGGGEPWLAIIAIAVVVIAVVQVGAVVAAARMARRMDQIATDLETGIKPLLANLTATSAEASRATAIAAAQIERVDRLFTELAARVDHTLEVAQDVVRGSARDGMAIVAGIRAAAVALRGAREAARRRRAARSIVLEDDEESLFIG